MPPIKISQQQREQQQQSQHQQQQYENDYQNPNKNSNYHHLQHITNSQFLPQQQQYQQQEQTNNIYSYQLKQQQQQQYQHQHQQQLQLQQQQQHMMLQTIKQQLLENNVVTKEQLQTILLLKDEQQQQHQPNQPQQLTHKQSLYAIITHLTASLIEHNQHMAEEKQLHQKQVEQFKQTINKNDQCAISALQMFYSMTQVLGRFSQTLYGKSNRGHGDNENNNDNNNINNINQTTKNTPYNNKPPIQIYKHFRQVYEITQQLSSMFNKYQFTDQDILQRRNVLLEKQIQNMQRVFQNQSLEIVDKGGQLNVQGYQYQQGQYNYNNRDIINPTDSASSSLYPHPHPHPTNLPTQTSQYILSLRQQINNLHQTLLKNDQQFTFQIQLTQTVKAYEKQIAKIIHYQLKIEQLQKIIVRFREDRNMAKKIRNYQKDLKGDHAFISPQRQRLISSPQTRYSMLNSKLSVANSLNINSKIERELLLQQQQHHIRTPMVLQIGGMDRNIINKNKQQHYVMK